MTDTYNFKVNSALTNVQQSANPPVLTSKRVIISRLHIEVNITMDNKILQAFIARVNIKTKNTLSIKI